MQIQREDLDEAAARRIVDASQAAALWRFFGERHPARARFTGVNVSFFFGALVVIAAMGWLMTLGFERLGPWAVCFVAVTYSILFAFFGERLLRSADLKIPGGLLYTMAVCMTPLAIWGLEKGTGFWPVTDPGHYRDFYPYIRSSVLSVLLRRRIFLVYGAIGVNLYLVGLAHDLFKDSMLFPFALTLLGLSVIALTVKYQRNRRAIDVRLQSLVPEWLRELLPRTRFSAAQYL
jgi:hypothetical protein